MTTVRVYTREVTIQIDTPFKALIPSFDPIKDGSDRVPNVKLGERFSFDVEIPHGYHVEDLAEFGHKCVAAPDGRHLDVFDVMTKVWQGTDGFRLAPAYRTNS